MIARIKRAMTIFWVTPRLRVNLLSPAMRALHPPSPSGVSSTRPTFDRPHRSLAMSQPARKPDDTIHAAMNYAVDTGVKPGGRRPAARTGWERNSTTVIARHVVPIADARPLRENPFARQRRVRTGRPADIREKLPRSGRDRRRLLSRDGGLDRRPLRRGAGPHLRPHGAPWRCRHARGQEAARAGQGGAQRLYRLVGGRSACATSSPARRPIFFPAASRSSRCGAPLRRPSRAIRSASPMRARSRPGT